jgi:hypothetical protein
MEHKLAPDVEVYLKVKKKLFSNKEKIFEITKFSPHPKQELILDTFFDGLFSIMTITCGRRFGKTYAISEAGTAELLVPNASILIITPTFSNAKTLFENIERSILNLGIKITSRDSKALTFTLENRATIFVVTPKSIANALGRKFSLVIVDEGQDIDDLVDLFENYIQPAMADFGTDELGYNNAKAIFIGTARDESNDLYELITRANSPKYFGYVNYTFPTSDNPYIPKAYLAAKKRELDPITYGREYEGKWSKADGELIYYTFDEDKNVVPHNSIKYNKDSLFIAALDVGFTDNTGYLVAYVEPLTGHVYIVGEYKDNEAPLSYHQKNIKELDKQFGKIRDRFIDPAAAQVANDLSVDYGIYTTPAYNKIDEGIKYVNQAFYRGELLISDKCVDLIAEIKNLYWANPKTKTVKKTKKFKHFDLSLSTMRYLYATWKIQSNSEIIKI